MNWLQSCAAVVPCFDEEAAIGGIVRGIRPHLQQVIVVDDGSADETARAAVAAGATVVRHSINLGKGAAVNSGLSAAQAAGFSWAALLDGDGQHKPEDLPLLLGCAERTKAVLVVGDRMHNPGAMPWLRRQVNRWMSRKLSQRSGRPLPDTQCGFRLVNLEAWRGLRLRAGRFEVESEMLLAFIEAGYRVEFVPIQVVGRGAHSHIDPVRDTWRWFKWWNGLSQSAGDS
jgi:glycosyltransferase involved in cell wall biosynthesis